MCLQLQYRLVPNSTRYSGFLVPEPTSLHHANGAPDFEPDPLMLSRQNKFCVTTSTSQSTFQEPKVLYALAFG